jgi:hypothetical protein|tara:strand:+ start:490 stop:753 length:264 start_codon:yes stop_codon:yes gene_type:complete
MKIFIYKTLFVFFLTFVLFQLTIGVKLKQLNKQIEYIKSDENIQFLKEKIRKELRSATKKEKILNDDDAKLMKLFLEKINVEINNAK